MRKRIAAGAALCGLCVLAGLLQLPRRPDLTKARVSETYGKLPLRFEANQGQADASVKFISPGRGYTLGLTSTGALLSLKSSTLRMELRGANANAAVSGLDELHGKSNYFIGNDPAKWRTNVPSYAKVAYRDVYPGVDLIYYGSNQRQLEYDFVVAPGVDPSQIRLAFHGAEKVALDPNGDLQVAGIQMHRPLIYQNVDGSRRNVGGGFRMMAENVVGFEVAAYDASRPLVIDPVLAYATYVGSTADDEGLNIAVDSFGSAYVAGETRYPGTFPTTPGAFQRNFGNPTADTWDAFVFKLNAAGSGLDYSTYMGGSQNDWAYSIAVDSSGNAYVAGQTFSTNFPTVGGVQLVHGGGSTDGFVAKLNPTGSALVYSSYLGGSAEEYAYRIAVDPAGNAYVAGYTSSSNFPTANAAQATHGGATWDAFVTKINPAGSAMIYSTYLGGTGNDYGQGIAADSAGNAYVTGATTSGNFPTTAGVLQTVYAGGSYDAFVTKYSPTGAMLYSTFVGTNISEQGYSLAVDSFGNTYVAGISYPDGGTAYDLLVFKLNAAGAALVYSNVIRGTGQDVGNGIVVDGAGNAYVAGYTNSPNFPAVNAVQLFVGDFDALAMKLDATGAILYSTFLGGSGTDYGQGVAIDPGGNAYVSIITASTDFPVTGGAYQTTYGGGTFDAGVFKIGNNNPVPVITTISPSRATAGGLGFDLTVNGSGFSGASVIQWNGSPRNTTFVSSGLLMAFGLPASDIASPSSVPISVSNPAPAGGVSTPVTFSILSSSGTVAGIASAGAPAATATIPIRLTMTAGSIDSLSFGVLVVPGPGAPALTGTASFVKDSTLPVPSATSTGANQVAVGWLPFPSAISGTVHLGDMIVNIPAAAVSGQTYSVQITGANASLGVAAIGLLPGPIATLTVGGTYLVGDGSPFTLDSWGSFGDGSLDNFDLIAALRAVTFIPGARPQSCADRYDAMDAFPVDGASRGGDTNLDNFDLIQTLRRVTLLDTTRPTRAVRGLPCSAASPLARNRAPEPTDPLRADAALAFGDAEGGRIPVYLTARNPLSLAGFSFSLGVAGGRAGQLRFTGSDGRVPSLLDQELPGMIAVAWLDGLAAQAGETVLLGYVDTGADNATLRFYGVVANTHDGRAISMSYPKMGSGQVF